MKSLRNSKGSTSLNRLLVLCEGPTDIPVFEELVGQAGEIPEIVYGDVGGWSGLRNKDPEFLLLGSKAVIVVMDGDEGRRLSKHNRPLAHIARELRARLAAHGIELLVVQRYGIENYFPQAAVERVVGRDLTAYFPVPHDVSFTDHLSADAKGPRYRFRQWVASRLDLKMPSPRQPLYFKNRNRAVAQLMSLDRHVAGTDLAEIVQSIARSRA